MLSGALPKSGLIVGRTASGCRALLVFAVAALLVFSVSAKAHAAEREYEIKAAFFYNFTKFVKWPAEKVADKSQPFSMCILGYSPVEEALRGLEGREILGKAASLRHITEPADAAACHMVFVGALSRESLDAFTLAVEGRGVLSVGDSADSAGSVVINMFIEENKVRFSINNSMAIRTGIDISSYLLELSARGK